MPPAGTVCYDVLNMVDPQNPLEIGQYFLPGMKTMTLYGLYLYVSGYQGGLLVMNTSDPEHLQQVQVAPISETYLKIEIAGSYAYLLPQEGGLKIINLANPAAPVVSGSYNSTGVVSDIAISGSYAYIAIQDEGFEVLNIQNPYAPVKVGTFQSNNRHDAIETSGQYVYLADMQFNTYETWLRVIDVSNPAHPVEVGIFHPNGSLIITDMKYEQGLLYASTYIGQTGIYVIDVSVPTQPRKMDVPEDRYDIFYQMKAKNRMMYLIGLNGVVVERYTGLFPALVFDLWIGSADVHVNQILVTDDHDLVPLVAKKQTFVRIYPRVTGADKIPVKVTLKVHHNGWTETLTNPYRPSKLTAYSNPDQTDIYLGTNFVFISAEDIQNIEVTISSSLDEDNLDNNHIIATPCFMPSIFRLMTG